MQRKVVYAGANNTSYRQAAADLEALAELRVGDKQVRRVCKQVGRERVAERDTAAAEYRALPLARRKAAPPGVAPPRVAVVGVDGGRLQIIDRPSGQAAAPDPTESGEPLDAPTADPRHWREDKIAILMTLGGPAHTSDPCPEVPAHFVDPLRILKLAREFKHPVPAVGGEAAADDADAASAEKDAREWVPEVTSRRLAATRRPWDAFGPLVAARAWACGFYAAEKKGFVGDGSSNNWTLWQTHFSSFTPILDFIHGLSYVFAAATAGRDRFADGWGVYVRWIGWVWEGRVGQATEEMAARAGELDGAATESGKKAREVVVRSLEYLRNNASRMKYDEYRRDGLPTTSSHVESAVKQFNYRVKGSEKFWNEDGAEEMLQLRADFLSDDEPLTGFWKRREGKESGQRRYRKSG